MPTYHVKDEQTGREVTFDWHDETPPTEADMEEVFAEASAIQQKSIELAPQPAIPAGALQQQSIGMAQKGSTPAGQSSEWSELPKNIIPSAVQMGKEVVSAAVHPIQTAKAVGALAKGGIEAATEQPGDIESQERKMFSQVVESAKDKYGSLENLKKDIIKDPVGNLANAAGLLMTGGGVLRAAGGVGKLSKVAKAGKIIGKTGAAIEPVSIATLPAKAIAIPLQKITDPFARKLYESAAKFSTTLKPAERTALIETALKHKIPIRRGGLKKLQGKIDDINNQISNKIDELTQAGDKINVSKLFKHFDAAKEKAGLTATPIRNQAAIERIRGEIFKYNEKIGKYEYTPAEVQRLKQNIYKEVESLYGKTKKPVVADAKMALARGAKESLEVLFPEIKQLNKTEGSLIELNKALERSVNRVSNNNIISLSNVIGMTGGGVAGASIGGTAGAGVGAAAASSLLTMLSKPAIKSALARVVYDIGKKGIKISPTSAAARLGLINLGRARYAGQKIQLTEQDFNK